MKIYLTGASGFIGQSLARSLDERGHAVICGMHRSLPDIGSTACAGLHTVDFAADIDPAAWLERLRGAEVVVNAVGLIRERGNQSFDAVHAYAPIALFTAAVSAGCRRIVQVSALGADENARSRYHLSKRTADDFLATLPLDWVIVRPSVVYGPGGQSARLFTMLASLPWIPLPGRGEFEVQPIHLDDLVEAIVALVEAPAQQRRIVPLVGPEPLAFADFLAQLRRAMGLRPTRYIRIPRALMYFFARLLGFMPGSILDRETLGMLFRGNTAQVGPTRELLHREPRAVPAFLPARTAFLERSAAQLRWLLPVLRGSIGIVWIATGVVSLWFYPVTASYALLARTGISGDWAPAALYGAATLNIVLGLASLLRGRRQWLWLLQIALILAYTIIISLALPEFWAHPYGPVLKNLPMLAAIWLVYELEKR
ncbi:MAG TPA: SDR family oxidoreductase [Burkholderiales bacterium]|nr:SDR family oxidoreductase [Burkholderiales bacterium]